MIVYYVLAGRPVPPSPEALVAALGERGVWRDLSASTDTLVWDALTLSQPPFEATVFFTVGDALPVEVREWMPWAGMALDDDARELLMRPVATFRVEVAEPEGMSVQGPSGTTRIEGPTAEMKDAPRRGAQLAAAVAAEIAMALDGVVVDVPAQRFWSAEAAPALAGASFDVRNYVSVHADAVDDAMLHLHTHGLERFGKPDVEMGDVPRHMLSFGTHVLNEVAQHQALGNRMKNGENVMIDGEYVFAVTSTARSREHCGNDVVALVDPPDAPQRDARAPRYTLSRFAEDVADDLLRESDLEGALQWLSTSILLAPWRAQAWRKRAGVNENMARPDDCAADLAQAESLGE